MKKLIIIPIVILLGMLLFLFVSQRRNTPSQTGQTPLPTPYKSPYELSSEEKRYPNAIPQLFPSKTERKGMLVISSNILDIRVMITLPDGETATPEFPAPINITPFKITTIPVGTYTVLSSKQGYTMHEDIVTIEENMVTRVEITLDPLQGLEDYHTETTLGH